MEKIQNFYSLASNQNYPIEEENSNFDKNEHQTIINLVPPKSMNNNQNSSQIQSQNEILSIPTIQKNDNISHGLDIENPSLNLLNISPVSDNPQLGNYSIPKNQFEIKYSENIYNQSNQEENYKNINSRIYPEFNFLTNAKEEKDKNSHNLFFNTIIGGNSNLQEPEKSKKSFDLKNKFENSEFQKNSNPFNININEKLNQQYSVLDRMNTYSNFKNFGPIINNAIQSHNSNMSLYNNNIQNMQTPLINQDSNNFSNNLKIKDENFNLSKVQNQAEVENIQNKQNLDQNFSQLNTNYQIEKKSNNTNLLNLQGNYPIINSDKINLNSNIKLYPNQQIEEAKAIINHSIFNNILINSNKLSDIQSKNQEIIQQSKINLPIFVSNINTESSASSNSENPIGTLKNIELNNNSIIQNYSHYSQVNQSQSLPIKNPLIPLDLLNNSYSQASKSLNSLLLKDGNDFNNFENKEIFQNNIYLNELETQKINFKNSHALAIPNLNCFEEMKYEICPPMIDENSFNKSETKGINKNNIFSNELPTQKINFKNTQALQNSNSDGRKEAQYQIPSYLKQEDLSNVYNSKGIHENEASSNEIPTEKLLTSNPCLIQNSNANNYKLLSEIRPDLPDLVLTSNIFPEKTNNSKNLSPEITYPNKLELSKEKNIKLAPQYLNIMESSKLLKNESKINPLDNHENYENESENLNYLKNNKSFNQPTGSIHPIKIHLQNKGINFECNENKKYNSIPILPPYREKDFNSSCIYRSQLVIVDSLNFLKTQILDIEDEMLEEIFNFEKYQELRIFEFGKIENDYFLNFFFDLSYILIIFQLKMLERNKALLIYNIIKKQFHKLAQNDYDLDSFFNMINPDSNRNEDFNSIVSYILKSNLIFNIKLMHFKNIYYSKNIQTELAYKECLYEISQILPVSFNVYQFRKNNHFSSLKIETLNDVEHQCKALIKIKLILTFDKLYYSVPKSEYINNYNKAKRGRNLNENNISNKYMNCLISGLDKYKSFPSDGDQKPEEFIKPFLENADFSYNINKREELNTNIKKVITKLSQKLLIIAKNIYGLEMIKKESSESLNNKSEIVIYEGLYQRKNEIVQINNRVNFESYLCMFCQDKNQANSLELKNCGKSLFHYYHRFCLQNYLDQMIKEKKKRSDILCLICGTEFEIRELSAVNKNAAKIFSEANSEELKRIEQKDDKIILFPNNKGLIKNTKCNHEYSNYEIFTFLENNFDKNKLNSGLKCPIKSCDQNIDESIILYFLANNFEKNHNQNSPIQNSKSAIEINDKPLFSPQFEMKNIRRAVFVESLEQQDMQKSLESSNEIKNQINSINISNKSKDSLAEKEEQITNPSCNHSFSVEVFDLLIGEYLMENKPVDEIQCFLSFNDLCNEKIDPKLIEDSIKRIKDKKI